MSKTDSQLTRRSLVKSAGAAALLAQAGRAAQTAQSADNVAGANDRVRVAFIGVGARGFGGHVRRAAQVKEMEGTVELAAVSDVYDVHRERALDFAESQTGVRPKGYRRLPRDVGT